MIFVGIDDTDTLDTPGTNQLARALAARVAHRCPCVRIIRHQLLEDPRVPCTSKNGSASLLFESEHPDDVEFLIRECRAGMRDWFVEGSDPGLCVAPAVSNDIMNFGRTCQHELVDQRVARAVASKHDIFLEGLGGTEGGVIGALAAVGLAAGENDGRVVQIGRWPDDLSGPQEIPTLHERRVEVRRLDTDEPLTSGTVDVGKHLRPNLRQGRTVLFVEPENSFWKAVRLK